MKRKYAVKMKCTYEGVMEAVITSNDEESALEAIERYIHNDDVRIVNDWLLMNSARVISIKSENEENKH